jgi:hypothetical protein
MLPAESKAVNAPAAPAEATISFFSHRSDVFPLTPNTRTMISAHLAFLSANLCTQVSTSSHTIATTIWKHDAVKG